MKALVALFALVSTSAFAHGETVCKVNASGSKYIVTLSDDVVKSAELPSGEVVKLSKLGSFDGFDDSYTMYRAPLNGGQIIVGVDAEDERLDLTHYDAAGHVSAHGVKSLNSCH